MMETISFTQREIARLNRMVGITFKNGEVEFDVISESVHQKIADTIANGNASNRSIKKSRRDT